MMNNNKNIVLIGFMGAGKTLVAECLGRRLGREVVSTDALIEEHEGRSIAEIFEGEGESHFRSLERAAVEAAAAKQGCVIDCGGGGVLDPANMILLKRNGVIFYISASPEYVYDRTKGLSHRPLLNVPDPVARIRKLLEKRLPLYTQADYTVDSDGKTPKDNCEEIFQIVSGL